MNCPRCNKTGSVPTKVSGETRTCPLCRGMGALPPLQVIREDDKLLALHYWECSCTITRFGMNFIFVHPTNHEHCEKCGLKAEDASLAPAGYARAFLEVFYDMEISFEYLSGEEEDTEDSG